MAIPEPLGRPKTGRKVRPPSKGSFKVADTVVGENPDQHTGGQDPNRRDFIHIAAGAAAVGAVGALAWPFIDQMNPAGDTLALASIEFDLTKVAPGQQVTVKWRGKPLFVRNRTAAEIERAIKDDNASDLKDPQKDEDRHKPGKAQWLVLVGTCTHLGCVPTFGGGDYGGWFCPCHGSHYDTSGRIRKGPAPKNLQVPEYDFLSDTKVKIG
jgi:ubiquinol-cytochrome c reductase iron-sulfur subunit